MTFSTKRTFLGDKASCFPRPIKTTMNKSGIIAFLIKTEEKRSNLVDRKTKNTMSAQAINSIFLILLNINCFSLRAKVHASVIRITK